MKPGAYEVTVGDKAAGRSRPRKSFAEIAIAHGMRASARRSTCGRRARVGLSCVVWPGATRLRTPCSIRALDNYLKNLDLIDEFVASPAGVEPASPP
jgi:hypothetical protein